MSCRAIGRTLDDPILSHDLAAGARFLAFGLYARLYGPTRRATGATTIRSDDLIEDATRGADGQDFLNRDCRKSDGISSDRPNLFDTIQPSSPDPPHDHRGDFPSDQTRRRVYRYIGEMRGAAEALMQARFLVQPRFICETVVACNALKPWHKRSFGR